MTSLLLSGLLLLGGALQPAWAAKPVKVYVNGTEATGMKDFQFKAVDVRIDADGNVWIDAPRYRIEVSKPAVTQTSTSSSATNASTPSAILPARHWLVTQDMGSAGQVIEVLINGTSVREIRSGQAQLILDIGPFLKAGSNVITFRPIDTGTPTGAAMQIHLGEGTNESGTLKLQNPQVSYSRTGTEPAGERSVEYIVR